MNCAEGLLPQPVIPLGGSGTFKRWEEVRSLRVAFEGDINSLSLSLSLSLSFSLSLSLLPSHHKESRFF
jgi:hypothetical protein